MLVYIIHKYVRYTPRVKSMYMYILRQDYGNALMNTGGILSVLEALVINLTY